MAKNFKSWDQIIETEDIEEAKKLISSNGVDATFKVKASSNLYNKIIYIAEELTKPLILASMRGKKEMVKFLLKNNADVNGVVKLGELNALQETAQTDHTEILKILIENGADINHINVCGGRPLSIAAENNKFQNTLVLVEMDAQADIGVIHSVLNNCCKSIIEKRDIPAVFDYLKIARLLISRKTYDYNQSPKDGSFVTTLNYATQAIIGCKKFQKVNPRNQLASEAAKLASENLLIMANSSMMTEDIIKDAMYCSYRLKEFPKISEVFGKLIQENPLWSIFNNSFLLKKLNLKLQMQNSNNLERSLSVYDSITDSLVADSSSFQDNLIDLIISYSGFTLEVDFAAAKHFMKQALSEFINKAIKDNDHNCEPTSAQSEIDFAQPSSPQGPEIQLLAEESAAANLI